MNLEKTQATAEKVLCIEDNVAFVSALRAMAPGRVVGCEDLKSGMEKIKAERWSRVVLDLCLPDSPMQVTISLIPAIKRLLQDTPLIVMTGFPVDHNELIHLGASFIIEKTDSQFAWRMSRALT